MLKNLLREFGTTSFVANWELDVDRVQVHNLVHMEETVVSSVNGVATFVAKKTNSLDSYTWIKTLNVYPSIGLGFGVYSYHGTDSGGVGSGVLPVRKGQTVTVYGTVQETDPRYLLIIPFKNSK